MIFKVVLISLLLTSTSFSKEAKLAIVFRPEGVKLITVFKDPYGCLYTFVRKNGKIKKEVRCEFQH